MFSARKTGDQTRSFFTAPGWIHMTQKVDGFTAVISFQTAIGSRRQTGNQIRLARLGQAKKTNRHRATGNRTQAACGITRTAQFQQQAVCLSIQALRRTTGAFHPVNRLPGPLIYVLPVLAQVLL